MENNIIGNVSSGIQQSIPSVPSVPSLPSFGSIKKKFIPDVKILKPGVKSISENIKSMNPLSQKRLDLKAPSLPSIPKFKDAIASVPSKLSPSTIAKFY